MLLWKRDHFVTTKLKAKGLGCQVPTGYGIHYYEVFMTRNMFYSSKTSINYVSVTFH